MNWFDMLAARRGKKSRLAARGAHQAARRVFLVGVRNHLIPRELAASVLPACENRTRPQAAV
jgi:hypothetical protein